MKASETIIKWLNEMVDKFGWISFKYEYSDDMKAHLVCVYPQKKIDLCGDYCTEEVNFGFSMDKLFPKETLLFSTEEQLFSCSESALHFKKATYSENIKILADNSYSFSDGRHQKSEYYDLEYTYYSYAA